MNFFNIEELHNQLRDKISKNTIDYYSAYAKV